jgi:hypothetical protein
LYQSVVGILSHIVYATLLKNFPFVNLVSLEAILSLVAFVVSHFVWIQHFRDSPGNQNFLTMVGFFFVMLWLVPFGISVSVSINENILPGVGPSTSSSNGLNQKQANLFKYLFDFEKWKEFLNLNDAVNSISRGVAGKYDKSS